ncbi:MAG: hypothetical protein A2V96_00380 [Candidatus Yonathbacteria bacterium RBG_16_43_6]|nr:MAG: hypothetical protein A2V96_00380 [Candidatus Yonathbacteria bacterium RBG_16_43_6]
MDTLGALFGSTARVKILRLFLSNSLEIFSVDDVAQKSKVKGVEVRKEISLLKKIGFLSEKTCIKEVLVKKGTKEMIVKKRVTGLQFKQDFSLLAPLKNLIFSEMPLNRDEIIKRFRSVGKIKLHILAGVFIDEPDSRVDVLVVGDGVKKRALESALRSLESEIGKELSYSALETADFLYRVSVYDKFVHDVLDFKHDRVVDKLRI